MYHDGEMSQQADIKSLIWTRQLDSHIARWVVELAAQPGVELSTSYLSAGAFNRSYQVQRNDEESLTIYRFPILGRVAFPREKVINEVWFMKYVNKHTSIPLPKLKGVYSTSWGPCIGMEYVEGQLLSDKLKRPGRHEEPEMLDPNVATPVLAKAYRVMSQVLVEMSRCHFPKIAGVSRDSSDELHLGGRPMTLNSNQLVALANYPPAKLPCNTFSTATEYMVALAQTHLTHLQYQRNDAFDDEADCRKKYLARALFLKVAQNLSLKHDKGPFRLICDDLRPANVIVSSELDLLAVIDWEFSYAGPAEFTYCPPWWLLLAHPENLQNLDDFYKQYVERYELFLHELRGYEDDQIEMRALSESERLSEEMALSMENGMFWFCLAATSSFAFDEIYWRFIDQRHYGKLTSVEDRISKLSIEEQQHLDTFVRCKMQQSTERKLDSHRTLDEELAS